MASRADRWDRSHKEHMTPLLSVVGDDLDEFDGVVRELRQEIKALREENASGMTKLREDMNLKHEANRRLLWGILVAVAGGAISVAASAITLAAGGG